MPFGIGPFREKVVLPNAFGIDEDEAKSPIERELAEGCVRIHYQPIVDVKSRKIFAYEGLLRSTSQRFRTPPDMIAAAVERGIIGQLGRLMRQLAVKNCPDAVLFINLVPNEFNEGWLVRPDDPIFWHQESVYLEITESVPLSHFELCHSVLQEIRGKGCFLAVDDLGAGFSNIKYIADLSPEIVKLDRNLIAGLTKNSRQQLLVRQLVRLCSEMGARVVAEGVETLEELHAVIDTGTTFVQGFLMARPAPSPPPVTWPE